jgi:Asp-tRNA(Asn)/Glu-tRNA(Gln) amidotransferase A subunit family amidase
VVGFKPTFNRVPTDGVAIFSQSADTIGFFTPDVGSMSKVAAIALPGYDASANGEEASAVQTVTVG